MSAASQHEIQDGSRVQVRSGGMARGVMGGQGSPFDADVADHSLRSIALRLSELVCSGEGEGRLLSVMLGVMGVGALATSMTRAAICSESPVSSTTWDDV